mmetsp:Transcript_13829/g.30103  ORF Transcript_13829/g.30103 Transcript_13829/m.30103 type:complete len:663 (+) Transcript_13829:191-2179(+)|eukprot:CAMPEP_0172308224 /NCGR_PEP_ID=MMETSP1058-20130122/8892_1 /TAXON_ID=83371 /ORGANISM="Detonula confervacea, Strain CCMP 353" /LENGTH=662 /DNA_ID=CAMNT_0013020597 /DNA_START=87 /DNA_END=2075 /DNA_ORIENTATION=-
MIISAIGRCAIFLHIATQGTLVHAASFRGVAGGGSDDHHHHRTLQDICADLKNNACGDGCSWIQGGCVPAQSPMTPTPTAPPTPSPFASPTPPGMGYCSNDGTSRCWSTSECPCAAAQQSPQVFDRRHLQVCSPATKRNDCRKISGCDWVDNLCISSTPAPTPSPTPCACLGLGPTGSTSSPSLAPSDQPTNPPTPYPSVSPTNQPTLTPTDQPTKSTPIPTPSPTNPPTISQTQTYCGCPQCTTAIWNTVACSGSECYTCGDRISFKQTFEGGSSTESEACAFVSNEFPDGPCGPECNSETCIASDPTSVPTSNPTTAEPTKSPSAVTPSPTTPSPTEQFFCGCSACTTDVWNSNACNGSECYTCGSRISWLQSADGGSKTEVDACTQVSSEFSNDECGPACNPLLCNPEYLDEPDAAKLIWNDEFDVDGSPDSTKWDYDFGDGCDKGICGWGNAEQQAYTNDPSNVNITDGILRISAKSSSSGYTSTRMVTRGKHVFKYGRIQFRASVENCQALGTWPALWMLPENWEYGGWPRSGEIDVMETVGHEADKFFGTVHTEAYNHGINTEKGGGSSNSKSDWHVFEIDWQVDNIRFAIDQQVYYQFTPENVGDYTQWPFDKDFHLLMNIAVGGSWGGSQGVETTAFDGDGQYMEVDWVRVYSS